MSRSEKLPRCKLCKHIEDDHDGYDGLCGGLHTEATKEEWVTPMNGRELCGCMKFIPNNK